MSSLIVNFDSHVLTLQLNRPEKKNALDAALYQQLIDALKMAADDGQVRAVLLTGSYGFFSSGNDLQDFLISSESIHDKPVAHFLNTLAQFKKPVVAAVNGPAVGVAATLLMHCDLVYASETAYLHFPFINLGLCPEFAASYLLPRFLGHVRAAELLMLGEPFSAQKAYELGLVNEVLEPAALELRARTRAAQLAAMPTHALQTTKMLMKRFVSDGLSHSMQVELDHFGQLLKAAEFREALSALKEKRKPDFSRAT